MRIIGKIISCVLALGIIGGAAYLTYRKVTETTDADNQTTTQLSGDEILGDGKVMLPGVAHNVPTSMSVFGASADGEEKPLVILDASNKLNTLADWSVTYVESGEDASDAITVKPTSSGSLQVHVKFKKSFDEQIKLEVKSRTSDNVVSCTVDCVADLQYAGCYLCGTDFGEYADVGLTYIGKGTITPTVHVKEVWISINDDFKNEVQYWSNDSDITFKSLYQAYPNVATKYTSPAQTLKNYYFFETVDGERLDYGQFIKGWDDYSEEKQEQIKYGWFRAYDFAGSSNSMLIDFNVELTYDGYKLETIVETEMPCGVLTGEYYGKPSDWQDD